MSILQFFISIHNQSNDDRPKLSTSDINIVFNGNSLMKCTYLNLGGIDQYWPKQVQTYLSGKTQSLDFFSLGVDGQQLTTMIAEAPANIDTLVNSSFINICVFWEDANGIIIGNKTAQQNYDDYETYFNDRKLAGFDYVIAISGYYPRTPYGGFYTSAARLRHEAFFDLINTTENPWDVTIDLRDAESIGGVSGQVQDVAFFNDYLHLNNDGYDIIANNVINKGILSIFQL